MRLFVLLSLLLPAALLSAQSAGTISPGMSRAKVVAALGKPTTERTVSEFRYLFYQNSCGKACGMNDLVILRDDAVVDAIFRSPSRHYTGTSSSPAPISAKDASDRAPSSGAAKSSGTIRMKPPAEANDVRPSIPKNTPPLAPAPTTKPATKTP
jgi:outer membrane protein assembly factor BamE (lipoprotein component of BamABCDE complex)